MTKRRIIGAALFSLLLAGPALAAGNGHRANNAYDESGGRVMHRPDVGTSAGPYDGKNDTNVYQDGLPQGTVPQPPNPHGG
jgi:hypothetical protein